MQFDSGEEARLKPRLGAVMLITAPSCGIRCRRSPGEGVRKVLPRRKNFGDPLPLASAGRLTRRRKLLEHLHTNHSKFEFRIMRASTSYQQLLKPVDLFDRFVDLIHFYLVAAFVVRFFFLCA